LQLRGIALERNHDCRVRVSCLGYQPLLANSMNDNITIRASAMGGLFDCAYRFEGTQIMGMYDLAGLAAHLGSAVHAGTAVYDQSRIDGAGITPNDAAGAVVDYLHDPEREYKRDSDDAPMAKVEAIALTCHAKYCTDISPHYTFLSVEKKLEPFTIDVPKEGVSVTLTGRLDRQRVRAATNGIGISDVKTGRTAANMHGQAMIKGRGLQLGVYELLAEYSHGQDITEPAEVIGLQTAGKCHTGVSQIETPRRQILGNEDSPSLIEIAANMLKTGLFPPNPSSILCGPRYCPRHRDGGGDCVYHE
jgi:hypothetical protein